MILSLQEVCVISASCYVSKLPCGPCAYNWNAAAANLFVFILQFNE